MKIPYPAIAAGWAHHGWPHQQPNIINVPARASSNAGVPLESFVSFSIEFSYFPDFAGNLTHPNRFSNNLLDNIAEYSGTKPYIRVGGSSQDNALFVESQEQGSILNFASPTADQPSNLTFGPKFFESYHTWPDTSFIHGYNLKYNTTAERTSLLAQVPYACVALRGRLVAWEIGNEPDLYRIDTAGLGIPASALPYDRPADWHEPEYVAEWLKWTRAIDASVRDHCPDVAATEQSWYAPSLANAVNLSTLDPVLTWEAGLNKDSNLKVFTDHHYQGSARVLGNTLHKTLMNHTATVDSVNFLLNVSHALHVQPSYPSNLPFILGEGNSLAGQGAPGLSNTFGAALWGVDANLLMASNNISRFHMHQGTNYRYQAWQPINTNRTTIGTKPPYYGNIAVAAFLGNLTDPMSRPQVINIPLDADFKAAYASYVHGELAKVMLINLNDFNTTTGNNYTDPSAYRGMEKFSLRVPSSCNGKTAILQRLIANGSDAVSGVTFDGYSYNYELNNGKPVLLANVTRGETVQMSQQGLLDIPVPDSSAVLISFR